MSRSLNLAFVLVVATVVSFCGMGYELLIIRLLSGVSGDSVLSQSLTAGFFLLALGFGAYLYGRFVKLFSWQVLIRIEVVLSLAAVATLPAIAIASIYVASKPRLIIISQVMTILIGTLSGFELPALMDAAKPLTRRWFGLLLAANYVGALIASICISLLWLPSLGLYLSAWCLALLSSAVAACLFLRDGRFKPRPIWLGLAVAIFLPPTAARYQDTFEQFYLKSYYFLAPARLSWSNIHETLLSHAQIPRVRRLSTPYQEIDIVQDDFRSFGLERSDNFHLFIDQHKQFGSATEVIYHDTIIHGSINLAGTIPADVLIIGGGDGLMVRELLKYPQIRSITLVELDPEMIRLARTYPPLARLNGNSLASPKVKIELADGFTWLRGHQGSFDAMFVDLPHPVSTDLSRLFSYEFYTLARRRLNPNGFLVFDFPFDGIIKSTAAHSENRETLRRVYAAVGEAGFKSNAIFGSWETFIIARVEKSEFHFDYEKLAPHVSDASVFNLTLMKMEEPKAEANTIFQPAVLKPAGGGS